MMSLTRHPDWLADPVTVCRHRHSIVGRVLRSVKYWAPTLRRKICKATLHSFRPSWFFQSCYWNLSGTLTHSGNKQSYCFLIILLESRCFYHFQFLFVYLLQPRGRGGQCGPGAAAADCQLRTFAWSPSPGSRHGNTVHLAPHHHHHLTQAAIF